MDDKLDDGLDEEFKEDVYGGDTIGKRIGKALLVIILLALLFCGAYYVWKSGIIKMPDYSTDETPKKEDDGVITDEVKTQIEKKIKALLGGQTLNDPSVIGSYNFRSAVLKRGLTKEEKQFIALRTISYDSVVDNWEEYPSIKKEIEYEVNHTSGLTDPKKIAEEYGVKSFDDVNTYYRSLFGENLVDPEEESGKCPTVYYDEDTNMFLKFTARCGGTAAGYFMTYITDYQKTKDSITVTMSVGYANEVEDEVYSDYRLKDEKDLSFSELEVVGLLSGIEKNENNHYMITDDNKDQFSQYKLTFKKLEEDVYYFDRVMQVK